MTRYDEVFGGWATLDVEAATRRAYALGVQAAVGEVDRAELDAIRDEMDSAYARSVVDLAFDEGRTEASAADAEDGGTLWNDLVLGENVETADEADRDVPAALERAELLDRFEPDSRDALDLPGFLQR